VVKLLLNDQKVDVNQPSSNATPLYVLYYQGFVDIARPMLTSERIHVNKSVSTGATPFLAACRKGNLEVVKLLADDARIDVNMVNSPHYGLRPIREIWKWSNGSWPAEMVK